MPVFLWSARGGVPPAGDSAYDALLEGKPLPEAAAEALRPVAEAIDALNRAPETTELAGEATALAVFRGRVGMSAERSRSRRRRHPLIRALLSAKLAAAVAAGAVTLGGVAAAAYAGALPTSMQNLAHDTFGAPSAHQSAQPTHSATPVGPSATGHAAFGLCTAYAHLSAHGTAAQKAVAFRNLVTAAGGAANVTTFCAAVAHPGTTPSGMPASHPTGQPGTPPSTAHPTGKPTAHPSGKPSNIP